MSEETPLLTRLTAITEALAIVRTLDELAQALHVVVESLITVEYSGIYLMDFVHRELRLRYVKGFSPEERAEAESTAWERHPGWVVRNRQIMHVRDTEQDNRTTGSRRALHVRSRLWVPIVTPDEAVGAIGLASTVQDTFNQDHITVLQYAATLCGFMFANLKDRWSLEQQFRIAEEHRQELVALSSPLVEVWNGVIVLPIIGRMDQERAQQITKKLLAIVATRNIKSVILDLTGVATIDAASIEHLGNMHRAVQLLGSGCAFTGISGQTAALMTQYGGDLALWKTFATVRQALASLAEASTTEGKPSAFRGVYKRNGI